jgi:hypothetical protein
MVIVGLVFTLFTVGYILGVWTALAVVRQPQREYEEAERRLEGAAMRTTARARVRTTGGEPARVGVSQVAERY